MSRLLAFCLLPIHPSPRTYRSVGGIVLFVPALLAMQTTAPLGADEMWKYIAMAAMGGLVTAFVIGRNSVTRQDLATFEGKLLEAIEKQGPWTRAESNVMNQLQSLQQRGEYLEGRVNEACDAAHAATGVMQLTITMFKDRVNFPNVPER